MRVIAKKTSFMDASGEQWITEGKEYELTVSKYKFVDDAGDIHGATTDTVNDYFKIIKCEYCDEATMKSIYYDRNGEILEIYIEPDKTLSVSRPYGCDGANVKINYCPMCGIKLT